MPTMTGGQALMRSLYLEGVRVIFGLPGVQLYHALDALNDVPGIRLITTRHEQATAYMADGYARASGGVGTALMVPGPGLLNASAAISTAYSASSPVLVVSGQIERDLIGADRGILHEVNDQQDCIRPITKYVRRMMTAEEAPEAVHEAFRQLTTGRPRPVEIEMPPETMAEQREVSLIEAEGYPRPAASDEQVAEAARILAGARRPLIWAGGGVISSEGSEALVRLAERLQAPVITTAEGKGAIDDRHPLALGALRLRNDPVAKEEPHFDVILGVGSRMAFPMWLDGQRVVQIDVDPDELGRNWENTYGVAGDARTVMEQVDARLAETIDMGSRPSFAAETEALRQRRRESALRPEPQESYLAAVRRGAGGRHPGVGHDPAGLLRPRLLAHLRAAHLHHVQLLGQPGLRLPHGAGSQGGPAGPAGGGPVRRRRVPVQLPGTGHGGAARHQRGGGGVQRQRLRQRAARPGEPVQRPRRGRRVAQPRLRQAGRGLRRPRRPRRGPRSPGVGPPRSPRRRRPQPDRGAGGHDADAVYVGPADGARLSRLARETIII